MSNRKSAASARVHGTWDSVRAWSTSVRASAVRPLMAAPMCESISAIFSTLSGSSSGDDRRFSTARTTPSSVRTPTTVDPNLMASMAYSTWKRRPSGLNVFTPRSYSLRVINISARRALGVPVGARSTALTWLERNVRSNPRAFWVRWSSMPQEDVWGTQPGCASLPWHSRRVFVQWLSSISRSRRWIPQTIGTQWGPWPTRTRIGTTTSPSRHTCAAVAAAECVCDGDAPTSPSVL